MIRKADFIDKPRRVPPLWTNAAIYFPLKPRSSGTVEDPATRGSELYVSALAFCA